MGKCLENKERGNEVGRRNTKERGIIKVREERENRERLKEGKGRRREREERGNARRECKRRRNYKGNDGGRERKR